MVDDLLATGGTMKACCELVEQLGGKSSPGLPARTGGADGRDKLRSGRSQPSCVMID